MDPTHRPMNPTLRNILAVLAGIVVCLLVNGALIRIGGKVIAPPAGVNVKDMESVRSHIHEFQPKHFLFPFLAHALGSLIGAFVAAKLAASNAMRLALVVGGVHLIGGIAAATMIPAPTWFVVLDLAAAYLPMAWLGGRMGARR
ncbi:MAG TPA: hypothetical protein VHL57_00010 [Flavobacteriales bacterium]|nr:hypothetical protein [Flavobacteriales bacterium]